MPSVDFNVPGTRWKHMHTRAFEAAYVVDVCSIDSRDGIRDRGVPEAERCRGEQSTTGSHLLGSQSMAVLIGFSVQVTKL